VPRAVDNVCTYIVADEGVASGACRGLASPCEAGVAEMSFDPALGRQPFPLSPTGGGQVQDRHGNDFFATLPTRVAVETNPKSLI
jgi:hypothetical protein